MSGNRFPCSGSCCLAFARGDGPTSGKCGAIRASARRLNVPNSGRQIGGGGFFVNATALFTRSLADGADSAIAKGRSIRRVSAPNPDRIVRSATLHEPGDCLRPAKGSRFMASPARSSPAHSAHLRARRHSFLRTDRRLRAQDSDPVVARANGVDIRQSDLALAEDEVGASMPQQWARTRNAITSSPIWPMLSCLSQAAEQQKLGDRDDVKHRIALRAQQGADGNAAAGRRQGRDDRRCDAQGLRRSRQTDAATSRRCTRAISWFRPRTRPRRSKLELKKGADFATLAKEKSKDPGAAEGGDLG